MRDLVAAAAGLICIKVWHDVVQFVYYRERMRACTEAVKEGLALIRFGVDRGLLSSDWTTLENNAAVVSRAMRANM